MAEWSRAFMRMYRSTFGSGSNPVAVVVFFSLIIFSQDSQWLD